MYHNFLLRPASATAEATPSPEQETDSSTRMNVATGGANLFAGSPDPFADMLSPTGSSSPGKHTSPRRSPTHDLFATDAASQGGTGDVDNGHDALLRTSTTPVVVQHRTPER